MSLDLISKKCKPCEGGVDPFDKDTAHVYLLDTPGWIINDSSTQIEREFNLKKFVNSINFVNLVADLAESEGHHPDIFISFNNVKLVLMTHAIKGLSENDFIMAAKINNIYNNFNND